MKREFFGCEVEEALEKAEMELGIPKERLSYREVEGKFGRSPMAKKVAIIVELEEGHIEKEKASPPAKEEMLVRGSGDVEWAIYVLDGIFRRMGILTKTAATEKGEHIILTVKMLNREIDLRRGESRELRGAIQHIVNRAASRGGDSERRFIVDIGGTLEERSEQISELATSLAQKVSQLGKPLNIHLMDSQDRRLLHVALLGNELADTLGRGEKQFRLLTIEPKK